MKLIINTSSMRFGGAVQVALSFIQECMNFPEYEYHVFVGEGVAKSLRREEFPSNFHFHDFSFGPISIWKTGRIAKMLKEKETAIAPDCVVTTSGPSYWRPKSPHLLGYNLPLYIYSDSPHFRNINLYRKIRWFIKRILHFHYFRRDADAYIVQTDDVNWRVKKVLKTEKVFTVTNTHNSYYVNPKQFPPKLPPKQPDEIRLLTITSYYKHKNLEIISLLVEELKKRGIYHIRFVLTINDQSYKQLFKNGEQKEVFNVGPVKPEESPSLYQECDILFLPTLAECFSASYPEAMIMEKPIVTTDIGFAHNICGNAALFYEPMNPVAAANAIEKLISDKTLWHTLVQNGKERLTHFDNARERARKILTICSQLKK